MENLTVRGIDVRVLLRLKMSAFSVDRTISEDAKDILSRAVGIEPKSDVPPPNKGARTPFKLKGFEDMPVYRKTITVRGINKRVMGKLKAAAAKNKRTVSAEAREMITEAIGYDRPLPKGVESAHEVLWKVFAPVRRHDQATTTSSRKANGKTNKARR